MLIGINTIRLKHTRHYSNAVLIFFLCVCVCLIVCIFFPIYIKCTSNQFVHGVAREPFAFQTSNLEQCSASFDIGMQTELAESTLKYGLWIKAPKEWLSIVALE